MIPGIVRDVDRAGGGREWPPARCSPPTHRPAVFKIAFVLIAGLIAVKLLTNRASWVMASTLPGSGAMRAYGFVIGLSSSLMGVGGGSLSTMVLTLYGQPLHNAIATSAGVGVPITVAGTIGYMLAGLPHQAHVAAAVDRVRVDHRRGADGADLQPGGAVRRAVGAQRCPSGSWRSRSRCSCWRWRRASWCSLLARCRNGPAAG